MSLFMSLASLLGSMTFKIKGQFLTSLSPCADVHHCSCPSIVHTIWRKLLSAIPPREALRFTECPFSLAWEVRNSIDDCVPKHPMDHKLQN